MKKELLDRNEVLFSKLVPFEGSAETLEGEILRAANKICYRWYNDGDYFYTGYGIETAGNAYAFLVEHGFREALDKAINKKEKEYEEIIYQMLSDVLTFIESRAGDYRKNESGDMFGYDCPFVEDEEECGYDDYFYDDE